MIEMTYKLARRIVIAVVGVSVLLVGIVMLVTPGPAFVVIPAGLAILSIEFAWARHWLKKLRETLSVRNGKRRQASAKTHQERAERI